MMREVNMRRALALLFVLLLAGCAVHSPYNRKYVSEVIEQRTGHALHPGLQPGETRLPPGVLLDDGLSEDEAVAVALWNNAQFQADLTRLGFARADLVEAGRLRNPIFKFLFPVGEKKLENALSWPIDVIWQRPKRVAAAKFEAERVAESLVQLALDLGRDTLVAYAEFDLARKMKSLAEEDARLRAEIAEIAAARLQAGDISGLEQAAARLDALRAEEAAVRAAKDASDAEARFMALLGLDTKTASFSIVSSPKNAPETPSLDELEEAAFSLRPDLHAAYLAVESAGERLGWERSKILRFTAILDSKVKGAEDKLFVGPAFEVEVPIFNQNNGAIVRAKAEMEQAARLYVVVKRQIALEVKQAHTGYLAARQSLELCRSNWLPAAAEAAGRARKSYQAGEESYLFVLQVEQQHLEARQREAESAADLRRAEARLKHSTGFSLAKNGQSD
jgi:cobalt-zinc-cadmium efflux system outer membrane protein